MKWFRRATPKPDPKPAASPPREPEPEPVQVAGITPQAVQAALNAGEPLLFVDIRQRWDNEAQRPVGAISLPLNELPTRYNELDASQRIVLSCYHGNSSLQGAAFLMQQGFPDVASMSGGFAEWAAAGLPIEGRLAPDNQQ